LILTMTKHDNSAAVPPCQPPGRNVMVAIGLNPNRPLCSAE
jgi:hypothetical protein